MLLRFFAIFTILFAVVFFVCGYWWSDAKYFDDLIRDNGINSPESAFEYLNREIEFARNNQPEEFFCTPRYLLGKKYLWCDEGAKVLGTIIHRLDYETRLVDVIKSDGTAGHTYLQVSQNGEWKNYDTVLKKSGLTHEQIIQGFSYAKLEGYPRPRPYSQEDKFWMEKNFFIKEIYTRIGSYRG